MNLPVASKLDARIGFDLIVGTHTGARVSAHNTWNSFSFLRFPAPRPRQNIDASFAICRISLLPALNGECGARNFFSASRNVKLEGQRAIGMRQLGSGKLTPAWAAALGGGKRSESGWAWGCCARQLTRLGAGDLRDQFRSGRQAQRSQRQKLLFPLLLAHPPRIPQPAGLEGRQRGLPVQRARRGLSGHRQPRSRLENAAENHRRDSVVCLQGRRWGAPPPRRQVEQPGREFERGRVTQPLAGQPREAPKLSVGSILSHRGVLLVAALQCFSRLARSSPGGPPLGAGCALAARALTMARAISIVARARGRAQSAQKLEVACRAFCSAGIPCCSRGGVLGARICAARARWALPGWPLARRPRPRRRGCAQGPRCPDARA